MLKLPDVTLLLIETREHDLAQRALENCERLVEFGDVLVFTDRPAQFLKASRRTIAVPDWPEKVGWSKCFWLDAGPHIRTSHVLGIQWDSWVVHPHMWQDRFLNYDYIGSPWWYSDGMNVGNGGFCLRSTALLRYVRKHRAQYPVTSELDDNLFCRIYRPRLQDAGFEWAPEVVAKDFSFECVRIDEQAPTFGFHASFNFDYGLGYDEMRLLEWAALMKKSPGVGKGRIWENFVKKFPNIEEELQRMESLNGKRVSIPREGPVGLGSGGRDSNPAIESTGRIEPRDSDIGEWVGGPLNLRLSSANGPIRGGSEPGGERVQHSGYDVRAVQ